MLFFTTLNVAVASFWLRRHDTEGNQFALFCKRNGVGNDGMECGCVGNQVIGSQNEHDRIFTSFQCMEGSQSNSRCRIAPNRFKNDIPGELMHLSQLLGHQKTVIFIADNNRIGHIQTVKA